MPDVKLRPVTWMAWLFAIGSACFAIGVPVGQTSGIEPAVSALIFFVGSIFFTAAAWIQLCLAWAAQRPSSHGSGDRSLLARLVDWRDVVWSSSAVQWIGTLFFIATTLRSLVDEVGAASVTNQVIWRPDAIGSILFLISSAIACTPPVRAHRHGHVRDRSWLIASLNMLGSVFFGISAVGSYVVSTSDEYLNARWANSGTLLGALCFLVGALLVIPRGSVRKAGSTPVTTT